MDFKNIDKEGAVLLKNLINTRRKSIFVDLLIQATKTGLLEWRLNFEGEIDFTKFDFSNSEISSNLFLSRSIPVVSIKRKSRGVKKSVVVQLWPSFMKRKLLREVKIKSADICFTKIWRFSGRQKSKIEERAYSWPD